MHTTPSSYNIYSSALVGVFPPDTQSTQTRGGPAVRATYFLLWHEATYRYWLGLLL